jgi:fumarate reductase flavoprotein subunit
VNQPCVLHSPVPTVQAETEVVVIGAGACGLTAALKAHARGRDVLIAERDAQPSGSTSMSAGFIPAAGTRYQAKLGIDDSPDQFISDIQSKSTNQSHPRLAALAAQNSGLAIEWLADHAGIEWILLDEFLYPGHQRHRMHAVKERTGAALHTQLLSASNAQGIPVLTEARATTLWQGENGEIKAVGLTRPNGQEEIIACKSVLLACNGYGGNSNLVSTYIPEMANALYHGHPGNTGDALFWGKELGADIAHLSGYQGHGSLATPQNIPITWVILTEGGIQVNARGERFANELAGYSEAAPLVLSQPGKVAWNIYDARLHEMAQHGFADYRAAVEAGAVKKSDSISGLAQILNLPSEALAKTVSHMVDPAQFDIFGRDFDPNRKLHPPYFGVKVTGALFHTQGGLVINDDASVRLSNGTAAPNLFAAGGAACGVSGPDVAGYLSGNGLLSAIAFGFVAGTNA